MTQPGETTGMTASDHVRAVLEATDRRLFDRTLVNVGQANRLLPLYERDGAFQVPADLETIAAFGITPVTGDFISEGYLVRHDATKLAAAILRIAEERSESSGLNALLTSPMRRAASPHK